MGPRTVPNGLPRDAIPFAVVGLPFGLYLEPFMWIWDTGARTGPQDTEQGHRTQDRAIGRRTGP